MRDNDIRRSEHRRAVVNRYKRIIGCVDCGYKEDHRALEFDHLPEFVKGRNVASLMNHSWSAIKREIAKCEVVCANCHAIRTHLRY